MKRSWIIVLAFVFLYSVVPAFSAPKLPVPSELCLGGRHAGDGSDHVRLLLENKGTIGDTEYFGVVGSWVSDDCGCASLMTGSAHLKGRKVLHLGLSGAFDEDGPGGGATMYQQGFDIRYNLKKETGRVSELYLWEDGGDSGTFPLKAIDCSSLDEPPY